MIILKTTGESDNYHPYSILSFVNFNDKSIFHTYLFIQIRKVRCEVCHRHQPEIKKYINEHANFLKGSAKKSTKDFFTKPSKSSKSSNSSNSSKPTKSNSKSKDKEQEIPEYYLNCVVKHNVENHTKSRCHKWALENLWTGKDFTLTPPAQLASQARAGAIRNSLTLPQPSTSMSSILESSGSSVSVSSSSAKKFTHEAGQKTIEASTAKGAK